MHADEAKYIINGNEYAKSRYKKSRHKLYFNISVDNVTVDINNSVVNSVLFINKKRKCIYFILFYIITLLLTLFYL